LKYWNINVKNIYIKIKFSKNKEERQNCEIIELNNELIIQFLYEYSIHNQKLLIKTFYSKNKYEIKQKINKNISNHKNKVKN
jgi:hypothetical protein